MDTCCRVVGLQRIDLLGAALVSDPWPRCLGNQCQRLGHHLVQRLGAQAAAHHQQMQRPRAACETCSRLGLLRELGTQRVAHPFGTGNCIRKGTEHALGKTRQQLVGHAGNRVLLVQNDGNPAQYGSEPTRHTDVSAHAHHHIGLHAAQYGTRLRQRLDHAQGQAQQ
ncbi:hypothetical protein D3C72_1366170 [compost metagenome]